MTFKIGKNKTGDDDIFRIGVGNGVQLYQPRNRCNKYAFYCDFAPGVTPRDRVSGQQMSSILNAGRQDVVNGIQTSFGENVPTITEKGLRGVGGYECLNGKTNDISDAYWGGIATKIDYETFQATARYQGVSKSLMTIAGLKYTLSFYACVEPGGNTTGYVFEHISSASGNTTVITLTETRTRYSVTILGKSVGGTVGFGLRDDNTSNWSKVYIDTINVTQSNYLLPPLVNNTTSALYSPTEEGGTNAGNRWQIMDGDTVLMPELRDALDGIADGASENSGNLVATNYYEIVTTETDHFGTGKVVGNRITGLTTALDANNTVRQISSAKGELQIVWTPGFDYDESIGDQNVLSWQDKVHTLFHKDSGYIQLHDGSSWICSVLLNYQKNISYDINCVYGDHPTEGVNKMQIIITDGTTTWESLVVDFDGSFNPADFLTPFFGNIYLNYIKSIKLLKEQVSWA